MMESDRTIVHVDDDPAILALVAKKLENAGYHVVSVSSAAEALPTLLATCARVVLLDIDMPEKDGLTVLREIKSHDGGVQVIMLTGMVSMGTVLQSMRWGAEACVFKPIEDFDELIDAVEIGFEKIERWWTALHDWKQRKDSSEKVANASDPIPV